MSAKYNIYNISALNITDLSIGTFESMETELIQILSSQFGGRSDYDLNKYYHTGVLWHVENEVEEVSQDILF